MWWREAGAPSRMQRVALVAPKVSLRDVLVRVADAGTVELDRTGAAGAAGAAGRSEAARGVSGADRSTAPRLSRVRPDPDDPRCLGGPGMAGERRGLFHVPVGGAV